MTAFNWVCSCVDGDIEVVRADEHDALQARLAATERLLLVARDCLRTAHNGWAEALGREIHAFLGATAVQPERCCLDYPRCDCNSPPEPDADLLAFGYAPGNYESFCLTCEQRMTGVDKRCHCCRPCAKEKWGAAEKARLMGLRAPTEWPTPEEAEKRAAELMAMAREPEPLEAFAEGLADALGYYDEKRVDMPGFNDSGRCAMSGIKYEKLTGKDLIAALRGGACGDLLEDAAYAAADEIERLQKLLQKIMARCADLLDEDQFNEIDAMVTQATEPKP
jgi:hypothetical protein